MLRRCVGVEATTRGQQAAVTRYGFERVESFEGCLAVGKGHQGPTDHLASVRGTVGRSGQRNQPTSCPVAGRNKPASNVWSKPSKS